MERKIQFGINDGKAFFAHEMSINFSPMQFILDFKSITPRVDPRNKEGEVISLEHNVVLVDPYHAKNIHELLGKVIEDYEKKFGQIKKPKQIEAHEKNMKKELEKKEPKTTAPSYLG